jgi:hypothetical protein
MKFRLRKCVSPALWPKVKVRLRRCIRPVMAEGEIPVRRCVSPVMAEGEIPRKAVCRPVMAEDEVRVRRCEDEVPLKAVSLCENLTLLTGIDALW